jgi:predicted RNase H-like nuclease (RuvC/YqgF family)
MKKILFVLRCAAAVLVACDGLGGGSKSLKAENDSLITALSNRNAELDSLMSTFNLIQEGFRQIGAAENRVDIQRDALLENAPSARQQLTADIEFIARQMEENKTQIAKLQKQLESSSYNSSQLKKAIDALNTDLLAKQQRIEELQSELASRNIRIEELDAVVNDLDAQRVALTEENAAKTQAVAKLDSDLNTAWFVFGTKSELKEQRILKSGDVLQSADFNKDYFTCIDIRTTKVIRLYAKHAELLTTHPAGSYELTKDASNELSLQITDHERFWSVSRYLVIQVK